MRYDLEEHASLQVSAEVPMKTATPMNADLTVRLGKRMMVRGAWTIHPRSFTRPTVDYTFRRNDIDIYDRGDHNYSILYHQHQVNLIPFNNDFRYFNLQMGLRWDYVTYRDRLVSDRLDNPVPLNDDHYYSYRIQANYISEDNWIFPTRGARFKAEYA